MIFDQIKFHNVEEMVQKGDGYALSRLPREVAGRLDPLICEKSSFMSSGVELRFRMVSDHVTIHLKAEPAEEAQTALIYFGSFPGGWMFSTKTIGTEDTAIRIEYPAYMEQLEKVTAEEGLPYNPHMVRMILPYGTIMYLGREGETIPPLPGDEPERTYLAYGSSITHGSLGLVPSSTYVFQTAMGLGMDYINQGYPGTAFVERPMAEYLSQRKDWDIATLELGINLIGKPLSDAGFETRVAEFLDVMAADGRPVFVTDIYHFLGSGEEQRRAEAFRDIVRRQALRVGLPHIPGKTLLRESGMISADLTHPTWEGERRIAERWIDVLRRESIGW